jgi:hypothetical protein
LEPYQERAGESTVVIQPDLIDGEEEWEVERILDTRIRWRRPEWLVRWKGYGPADDEWLTQDMLANAQEKVREFEQEKAQKAPRAPARKRQRTTL